MDTSVVIDWDDPVVVRSLPDQMAISAVTLAERAASPHLASTPAEAAERQARVQQVESKLELLPFDAAAARSYGQVVAAVSATGGKHGRRVADPMIAATAHSIGLARYTRNANDFIGLAELVTVVEV